VEAACLFVDMLEQRQVPLNNIPIPTDRTPRQFFGVIFDEEVQHFVMDDGLAVFERRFERLGRKGTRRRTLAVRTFRAGPGDLAARIPSIASLREKKVLLVGLGALGSEAALHLARNGVGELSLLDDDFVEPGTVRRWALGAQAYGASKVYALRDHLLSNYPNTKVWPHELKIGSPRGPSDPNQYEQICTLISENDVVIDLAADLLVSHFLSDFCKLNGTPYILGNATPGGWGGMVYQWVPNRHHICWKCLRQQLYPDWEHLPAADPTGETQPPGCAARTFTGTSFDLSEITLEVMRTTAGLWPVEGGYPETPWQLAICNLREADGSRLLPRWQSFDINRTDGCSCG
jgi:molybdopterin/thiamine biosynthesis adenylyltransferase